jgi:hypothetical protein
MKKEIGLWIDRKKAVIVTAKSEQGEIKKIESNLEKDTRYSGRAGSKSATGPLAEDQQDRKFLEHLNKYYDEVITYIRSADNILIFGPGEAKLELEKRMAHEKKDGRIINIESADKMTDPQIQAKVRRHFTK